jgi:hypothetical protein
MAQELISAICRAHALGLEEICSSLSNSNSGDSTEPIFPEFRELLGEMLREQAFLRDFWKSSVLKLGAGAIADPESHRHLLTNAFDRFAVQHTLDPSTTVEWDEFERGCKEISSIRKRLEKNWPRIDEQRIGRAEEQAASDRYRTAQELLDELQHSGSGWVSLR